MKKILYFMIATLVSIGFADAAVRSASNNSARISGRGTTTTEPPSRKTTARTTVARTATTSPRNVISPRTATSSSAPTASSRVRSIISNIARAATARATIAPTTSVETKTFDSGYNRCRDAYFTCMDQFCATQNDTYRRCVCSSKLSEIQRRESLLSETADSLQTFQDLNIEIIPKPAAEVQAMLSASQGEMFVQTIKDKSASQNKLTTINNVLTTAKAQSLSTTGILDIGGNITTIRNSNDLTSGFNISNLYGDALYNAVHTQCAEFVSAQCPSKSILNMVVSAYGMYIENDCALLESALNKQTNSANASIRETEREMDYARLDNYNAHNSTGINDCIANVRRDITNDAACGPDYIHCLDVSGLYLNKETGEPIYTPNFYKLETQISLSGNILTNQTNTLLVAELNKKRNFAKNSLDTCRDLSDEVWDEFLDQAIHEIYQGQQARIRQVKDECLYVVNTCYDEQTQSLKDFSNTDEKLLIGSRLELAEEMCQEKFDTCSKLYGGGEQGLKELVATMKSITDMKIASTCIDNLRSYVKNMCAVHGNDVEHSYPYECRNYAPGEQMYARDPSCNQALFNINNNNSASANTTGPMCLAQKYISCNAKYYLNSNNMCIKCPDGCKTCEQQDNRVKCLTCEEEGRDPTLLCQWQSTCNDPNGAYIGSLYQMLVRYALQVCIRPSESGTNTVPENILQNISTVMTEVRYDMATELSQECERLDGIWVSTPPPSTDSTTKNLIKDADKRWGYCRAKTTSQE